VFPIEMHLFQHHLRMSNPNHEYLKFLHKHQLDHNILLRHCVYQDQQHILLRFHFQVYLQKYKHVLFYLLESHLQEWKANPDFLGKIMPLALQRLETFSDFFPLAQFALGSKLRLFIQITNIKLVIASVKVYRGHRFGSCLLGKAGATCSSSAKLRTNPRSQLFIVADQPRTGPLATISLGPNTSEQQVYIT
jgi:hypothetical protein